MSVKLGVPDILAANMFAVEAENCALNLDSRTGSVVLALRGEMFEVSNFRISDGDYTVRFVQKNDDTVTELGGWVKGVVSKKYKEINIYVEGGFRGKLIEMCALARSCSISLWALEIKEEVLGIIEFELNVSKKFEKSL